MKKQIAMLITLGLVLTVGVLATIYPQHAFAGSSIGNVGNTAPGGTAGSSPGQDSQGNDNSQGNEAGSATTPTSGPGGFSQPNSGGANGGSFG